jgi:U3 small nucleolar RNA-associated protein 22
VTAAIRPPRRTKWRSIARRRVLLRPTELTKDKSIGKKKAKSSLPTKDEQLQLNNTDSLLRSNLLKLQIDEMLGEVSCEAVLNKKKVQNSIKECMSILQSIGDTKYNGKEMTSSWLMKEGLEGFDVISSKSSAPGSDSIQFTAPSSIDIIGSALLKTGTSPFVNVDLAVGMPETIFSQNDILNHVYFKKRALYLGGLCAVLRSKDFVTENNCSVALLKGDIRKPVVVIKLALKSSTVTMRILPTMPNTVFKLMQFRPSKNNVRPASWDGKGEADTLRGTPHYNMSILEDIAAQTQHRFLQQSIYSSEVARNIIMLFKIWLTQRGMRYTADNVDGHTCTMLVAYLVQTKRITGKATTLSGFTILLKFLVETDFASSTLDFTSTKISNNPGASGEAFRWPLTLHYPVFDKSRDSETFFHYNILWRVSSSAFSDLVAEAKRTLQLLKENRSDIAFQSMFMDRSSFLDRHDLFFHIPIRLDVLQTIDDHAESVREVFSDDEQYAIEVGDDMDADLCDLLPFQTLSARVAKLASEALGNRIRVARTSLTHVQEDKTGHLYPCWPLSASKSTKRSNSGPYFVTLGLVLDNEFGHRVVERGPSVDDITLVPQFKRFWGKDKSQIRRFQDGSIIEAVVWDEEGSAKGWVPRGERIVEEVLRYILSRHLPGFCGQGGEAILSKTSQLEHQFLPGNVTNGSSSFVNDAGSMFKRAVEQFDRLRRIIMSDLKDIPLVIENVTTTSPTLRYSAPMPVAPHPLLTPGGKKDFSGENVSLVITPITIVANVEGGGKWPKKSEGVLKVKLALLLRIADQLMSQHKIKSVPHQDSLDVMYGGYIFRVILRSRLEVEKTIINDNPFSRIPIPQELIEAFEVKPLHHNFIKALHAQHPAFGPSVRLFSTWLSGHKLSGLLAHELIELVVASVYLSPTSELPPSSPSSGFFKALLRIATFDWVNSPLIIDFDNRLDTEKITEVKAAFASLREIQGSKSNAMYVVTSCDETIGLKPSLTNAGPSHMVLQIICREARKSLGLYSTWLQSDQLDKNHELLSNIMFSDDVLQNCDLVLFFNEMTFSKKANKSQGNEFLKIHGEGAPFARRKLYANLSDNEVSSDHLVVEEGQVNPIHERVVRKLRCAFGDLALFFWSDLRADRIGVLWRPIDFMPKKFSVTTSRHTLVAESFSVRNASEIVKEMLALSDGMLTSSSFL